MPPKKASAGKKAAKKKQEKIIDDKTFGLKNKKKSKKVQAFVASVAKQVTEGSVRVRRQTPEEKAAAELRARKRAKKLAEKEMALLMGVEEPSKKKKKKKEEEEAAAAEGGEFKSAAELAKEEMGAALEAAAMQMPVGMVEVTLDGTLEVGDHALVSVEDEIERRRAELWERMPAAKMVPATTDQLVAFKRKRDAIRAKEQKKADVELYGKGGRKGFSGREVLLRSLKDSGGVTVVEEEGYDGEGGADATASSAAAAAASSGAGADGAAAAVGDADVFLGEDDDLDDLGDSGDEAAGDVGADGDEEEEEEEEEEDDEE